RRHRRRGPLHGDPVRQRRAQPGPGRLLHLARGVVAALRGGPGAAGTAAVGLVQPGHALPLDRHAHGIARRCPRRVFPRDPQPGRGEGGPLGYSGPAVAAGGCPQPRQRAPPADLHPPHGRRADRVVVAAAARCGAPRGPARAVGLRPDARQHREGRHRLQDPPLRQHPQRAGAGLRTACRRRNPAGRGAPGTHRRGRHRMHRWRARPDRCRPCARLPLHRGPTPELRTGAGSGDAGGAQAVTARHPPVGARPGRETNRMNHRHLLPLLLVLATGAASAQATLVPQESGVDVRLRGISAVDADVAWASGREGTVLRTTDGGRHWQVLAVPGAEALDFRDIEAFDADTAVVLSIGPGEASRVYRTTDGGRSWTEALRNTDQRAFLDCMAFDGKRGWILGDPVDGRFQVLETEDGGTSWQAQDRMLMTDALADEAAFAASGTCIATTPWGGRMVVTGGAAARVLHQPGEATVWRAHDSALPS